MFGGCASACQYGPRPEGPMRSAFHAGPCRCGGGTGPGRKAAGAVDRSPRQQRRSQRTGTAARVPAGQCVDRCRMHLHICAGRRGGFLQDTGPRRHGGWRRTSGSGTRMWASKNLECSSRPPPFVTAGAALAHVDLALGLVSGRSPLLAATTARYLLVEKRASQAAFVIPDHLAHSDPLAERFERWSRSHLSQGFDLAVAASSVHSSARTLSRRIKAATGKTPLGFFQNLRLQHAVHLLETTTDSIENVAAAVGYADGVSLRALMRAKLGRGVREIRAQARSKLDL